MEIFSSKLQEPYYTYIKNGIKIYEMRVNDEKRKKMKIGDIWKFKNANNEKLPEFNTKIIDKKIYKSFEEAIKKVGYKKLLPNCKSIEEANGSWYFTFEYDSNFNNITIEKGSITINGVSLTVVNSKEKEFSVAIIPYTFEHTNFKNVKIGTTINLEFDVVGKYVARLYSLRQ